MTPPPKRIALIAHDNLKPALVAWTKRHQATLARHALSGTGTTGALVEKATGLPVEKFLSGPQGGDQQIGARVAEGKLDAVIFLWDAMSPHPHDVDVKALLRIAALKNIPIACNEATADAIIHSL